MRFLAAVVCILAILFLVLKGVLLQHFMDSNFSSGLQANQLLHIVMAVPVEES